MISQSMDPDALAADMMSEGPLGENPFEDGNSNAPAMPAGLPGLGAGGGMPGLAGLGGMPGQMPGMPARGGSKKNRKPKNTKGKRR